MSGIALHRLQEERKAWRKDHPYGFVAKPSKNPDGSLNMFEWDCAVPGKAGTPWEGGLYKFKLTFKDGYPATAPDCVFYPIILHPNVYDDGVVCLSLFDTDWKASHTLKTILLGVQDLLDNPNLDSPASEEAYGLCKSNKKKYLQRILEQAKQMKE